MNGHKLLDSNILIYLSKNLINLSAFASPEDELSISIITYMEVMGFPFQSKKEEQIITGLCENLRVINLDEPIVEEVIQIRKKYKVKLPDAVIAATARIFKMNLITHNAADFKSILPGKIIVDPLK